MEPLSVLIALAGSAAIVAFVAAPFVRSHAEQATPATTPAVERRDRALAALRELEFDHRTGKLADDDYGALLSRLRAEAAAALRAVDESA